MLIYNYILNFKSKGYLLLLFLSIISGIFWIHDINKYSIFTVNAIQDIANQILPLKIENGTIIVPKNEIKRPVLKLYSESKFPLPIVLDTTRDYIEDTNKIPEYLYITRKAIYITEKDQTRIQNFKYNIDLPLADYTDAMSSYANNIMLTLFLMYVLFHFLFYILICLFFAWGVRTLADYYNKASQNSNTDNKPLLQLNDIQSYKLSAVCLVITVLLSYIASNFDVELNMLHKILVLSAMNLFVYIKLQNEDPA